MTLPYIDPLAIDLVEVARGGVVTAAYDTDGTIVAAARLSAVLAAARAVIRGYFDEGDDEAPGLVELRDALDAADAATTERP